MISATTVQLLILLAAAAVSFILISIAQPVLRHYALARPNARSSHKVPTSQGGGIFVIAATVVVGSLAIFWEPGAPAGAAGFAFVMLAAIGLAVVGAVDDIRTLATIPRLVFQTAAVAAVITTLPTELEVLPGLPFWLERGLMLVGGVWFVNLVNFMDGIDWMTVAEMVPLSAALAVFGALGALPDHATFAALALCGSIVGFAPFNRPVAPLFLGDVGSLPIGLLVAWLLALLAGGGHLAAALLLPLYYLADATITLARRIGRREPITQAHRSHFYQRALDNGFSVYQIVGRVFVVNLILVALAAVAFAHTSLTLQFALLLLGSSLVVALLWIFNTPRRSF
jgi:UDP-N-acetylmuramyl pentapeptide phosphotransferase/UDP-N-acetylglucosamine-1-phosphate transferase